MSSQIQFDFDTYTTDNSNDIVETMDAITVTLSGGSGLELSPLGGEARSIISADLNWIDVISFTVRASAIEFDDLSVNSFETRSNNDDYGQQEASACPNSISYMLHIKDVPGLKFIRVYNNFGQKVLQSKNKSIDVNHLKKGLYFFKDLQVSRVQKLKKL